MNPRNFLQSEFRKKTNDDKSPENGISFIDNDMIMNILGEQEFNKGYFYYFKLTINNFFSKISKP